MMMMMMGQCRFLTVVVVVLVGRDLHPPVVEVVVMTLICLDWQALVDCSPISLPSWSWLYHQLIRPKLAPLQAAVSWPSLAVVNEAVV